MAEVLLTDAARIAADRFVVGAQWPRDHALYHPDQDGLSDPLLFAETIRQALVYLAHRFYAVPLTHRFIGSRLDFRITDAAPLVVGPAPLPVTLEVEWVPVGNRPPHRFGMEVRATLMIAGKPCGDGRLVGVAVDDKRPVPSSAPASEGV
ncbi:AfsA-related hotdog domain-containing protein, partial [Streptomyces sp. NPDC058221]|uniref:AfsA-related hotdog domain-containing protein n=1 Tax=Streptomyces sp. NPDC058221 TaxID=3346388 RepID=UPI0036E164B0